MAPATVQQTAAAKGESEDFGNFSYETQTEGLFVAFALKIPNAFTDFDLCFPAHPFLRPQQRGSWR